MEERVAPSVSIVSAAENIPMEVRVNTARARKLSSAMNVMAQEKLTSGFF